MPAETTIVKNRLSDITIETLESIEGLKSPGKNLDGV